MATDSLQDRQDLLELIARYAQAVDARQVDRVAECFAPSARLSANGGATVVHGRDAITEYFAEAFTRPNLAPGTASSHLLTNTTIEVGGDRADLVTLGMAVLAQPDSEMVKLRGLRYTDRCERIDGRWVIADRDHVALWHCDAPGGVL